MSYLSELVINFINEQVIKFINIIYKQIIINRGLAFSQNFEIGWQ